METPLGPGLPQFTFEKRKTVTITIMTGASPWHLECPTYQCWSSHPTDDGEGPIRALNTVPASYPSSFSYHTRCIKPSS